MRRPTIKTLEDAYEFVSREGICTLFSSKLSEVKSLWDNIDLPEEGGGRTKWGARVEAVWLWKNELPEVYPDDMFYGKIKGGLAVLMSMDYLRTIHYPKEKKAIEACSQLAQNVYEVLRLDAWETGPLRKEVIALHGCSKSQFDSALKQLQISLNIARSNEPGLKNDVWLPFSELYLGFEEDE
ncbi:hypothetical protein MLD52_15405 [Puniceicoccaceae bacterium K14]|nr:hypothetical protein [Puniceicoccaceae bacterium K14]